MAFTESQGRAWQWGRGLNHWDSNQTLPGMGEQGAQADLCRRLLSGVLLKRDAREEMGQTSGQRSESRGERKERAAAVAMELCTKAALSGNAGETCFLPATN